MTRPSLPENLDNLDKPEKSRAKEIYRRRLVHYHYVKNTEECNELHYAALPDPVGVLRRQLFCHASDPWECETLTLKVALIEATENWETLTGGGAPCPVVFDAEDVCETMKLDEVQRGAEETLGAYQNMLGFGPEGWVPTEHYEEAMVRSKQLKEDTLAVAMSAEERAEIAAHCQAGSWMTWTKRNTSDESSYIFRGVVSCLLYLWPAGLFPEQHQQETSFRGGTHRHRCP